MDDIVKQAMRKWPKVPACSGWLALDARGQWYMRDANAQASGAFTSGKPRSKGAPLLHAALAAFIGRNYLREPDGRWFFQNGPQRVYVELECTPWVWRLRWDAARACLHLQTHTGVALQAAAVQQTLLDEQGRLYLAAAPAGDPPALHLGLVHSQDVLDAAQALEQGTLPAYCPVHSGELPQRFGFVPSPEYWRG